MASSVEHDKSDKLAKSTSMAALLNLYHESLAINNKISVQILVSDSACTDDWHRPGRSIQTQIALALVFVRTTFKQTGPCLNLRFSFCGFCRGVGLSGFEPVVTCFLFATAPFKICCSSFLLLSSDGTVPACDQCRKASLVLQTMVVAEPTFLA